MIFALALLPVALARAHLVAADSPLLIPVSPPSDRHVTHFATFSRYPKGASPSDPWTSDYAPVSCHKQKDSLAANITLDPATWPYSMPASVTCSQGDYRVEVDLGFRAPEPERWIAADGTLVVPRSDGAWLMWTQPSWGAEVTSAVVAPAVLGVSCDVGGGTVRISVTGDAEPCAAVCRVGTADGTVVDRKLVLGAY